MTVQEAEHELAMAAERAWDKMWDRKVRECVELERAVIDLENARASVPQS